MKLIIQIPCFNESETLPITLKKLPRKIEGFDKVEWLVINDGSTDNTTEIAKSGGVDHIVSFTKNQGLARGFMAGLAASLEHGADVIVNIDADNQHDAGDIPLLVKPILEGKADIVIGARAISAISYFSPVKKLLQKIGNFVVQRLSGTAIPDVTSGFRAISREAALHLNVFTEYTYTLETIIQAGQKNMAIISVPVKDNAAIRPSKLIKSIPSYVSKSVGTIVKIFVVYQPFKFFMSIGLTLFALGLLLGIRFFFYFLKEGTAGHVQSLILMSVLLGFGFQTILIAFIANLLAVNRRLMEDVQYMLRKAEQKK